MKIFSFICFCFISFFSCLYAQKTTEDQLFFIEMEVSLDSLERILQEVRTLSSEDLTDRSLFVIKILDKREIIQDMKNRFWSLLERRSFFQEKRDKEALNQAAASLALLDKLQGSIDLSLVDKLRLQLQQFEGILIPTKPQQTYPNKPAAQSIRSWY